MKTLFRILLISCFFILLTACSAVADPAPEGDSAVTDAPVEQPTEDASLDESYPKPPQEIIDPNVNIGGEGYPNPEEEIENPEATAIPEAYPAEDETENEGDAGYPAPEGSSPDECSPEAAASQKIEFLSSDGTNLVGTFYPSASCNAPIVLLFHQYQSNKESWTDLARWLQNRSAEQSALKNGVLASPVQYPWFPSMPDGLSFNVFALDFRGHGESGSNGSGFDAAGTLLDAQTSIQLVKTLPNVSPFQIITIGASIGADASVDACLQLEGTQLSDFQQNLGCIGMLSLSPGDYLNVSYVDVVTRVSDPPFNAQVYCIASEQDGNSPNICRSPLPGNYVGVVYPDRGDHGIALLQEDLDPDIGSVILEFLLKTISQ